MFLFNFSMLNENPKEKYDRSPSHNILMGNKVKMKTELVFRNPEVSFLSTSSNQLGALGLNFLSPTHHYLEKRTKVKNKQSLSFSLPFDLGKFIKPFKSSVFSSVKWI